MLRLVDQRTLSLDATISTYLPGLRRDVGDRALLRHLLANTSDIPDLLTRQVAVEPDLRTSTASAAAIVGHFAIGDLAFEPGAGQD